MKMVVNDGGGDGLPLLDFGTEHRHTKYFGILLRSHENSPREMQAQHHYCVFVRWRRDTFEGDQDAVESKIVTTVYCI